MTKYTNKQFRYFGYALPSKLHNNDVLKFLHFYYTVHVLHKNVYLYTYTIYYIQYYTVHVHEHNVANVTKV